MALAKARRLSRGTDINRVYQKGSRGGGQSLFVRAFKNNLPDSRAVVIVGKKVSKKAVVRNKIRRQLTEQLVAVWDQMTGGQDIVVYVKEDLSSKPAEAGKDLEAALSRANVLGDFTNKRKAK